MRCPWAGEEQIYIKYHDEEWGIPLYDDERLFEMLCLEGAQAGLSWITILKRRAHYREVFDYFDAEKIALYDEAKIHALLNDSGIIRNKLKVNAFIQNAKSYLEIKQKFGSFTTYIWGFVHHEPIINFPQNMEDIPTSTSISEQMSKQLKKDGFKFVGPTICYAFMQAVGMVDDHLVDCICKKKTS